MKLVLFDVDGTLISTGGAGMRAFYRALKDHFDVDVNNSAIRPGRQDGSSDSEGAAVSLQFGGTMVRRNP